MEKESRKGGRGSEKRENYKKKEIGKNKTKNKIKDNIKKESKI